MRSRRDRRTRADRRSLRLPQKNCPAACVKPRMHAQASSPYEIPRVKNVESLGRPEPSWQISVCCNRVYND